MPTFGNYRDAQQSPLFDTYQAASSASIANRIAFFNSNTQSANGAEITNMPAAGFLPPPQAFNVFGLGFTPVDCDLSDIVKLMKQYVARLVIGTKTYLEAPLDFFPSPGGITGFATTTATTTTIKQFSNGVPGHGNTFALASDYSVKIESTERFEVNLIGTTGFTSTAAIFLRCYLLGVYEKSVQ